MFTLEHHARALLSGPAVIFTALIPDLDHFITPYGGGGRVLPLLHPNGVSTTPSALLQALSAKLGSDVSATDLLAYVAAVASHDGYTSQFLDELRTPGVRVPITADPSLWAEAVEIGRDVIWTQTYGAAYADAENGRPPHSVRFEPGSAKQVRALTPVTALPDTLSYDESNQALSLGDGSWGPVPPEVVNFEIGMRNIVESWFNYRRRTATSRATSPLDEIMPVEWSPAWTNEFTDLLSAIRRLVELQPKQEGLLERILAGPLVSASALADAGYQGAGPGDRRPIVASDTTLDLGI